MGQEAPHWDWTSARERCLGEAWRILRDPDDAEEAVQEAMIRAWRNKAACRTPAAPLPWLVQITRNEAVRLAARRQRRHANEVGEMVDLLPVESAVDRTIQSVATAQALSVLAPEDRDLIRLRYEEDLTQGQVAERLGIPEGTVKVRLHRVRARLRGVAAELAA